MLAAGGVQEAQSHGFGLIAGGHVAVYHGCYSDAGTSLRHVGSASVSRTSSGTDTASLTRLGRCAETTTKSRAAARKHGHSFRRIDAALFCAAKTLAPKPGSRTYGLSSDASSNQGAQLSRPPQAPLNVPTNGNNFFSGTASLASKTAEMARRPWMLQYPVMACIRHRRCFPALFFFPLRQLHHVQRQTAFSVHPPGQSEEQTERLVCAVWSSRSQRTTMCGGYPSRQRGAGVWWSIHTAILRFP